MTRVPIHDRMAAEAGVTLVELMVSMVVMSIVAAFFLAVVTSVNQTVSGEQERTENNNQARAALSQLDREVRSATEIYDPADETPANYSVRIFTQSNAPTRGEMCVQWEIHNQQLRRREWTSGGAPGAWQVVAQDVVNADLGVPAFQLDPDPNRGDRTLKVTMLVNGKLNLRPQQTVRLQTSLTGRNILFGTAPSSC